MQRFRVCSIYASVWLTEQGIHHQGWGFHAHWAIFACVGVACAHILHFYQRFGLRKMSTKTPYQYKKQAAIHNAASLHLVSLS